MQFRIRYLAASAVLLLVGCFKSPTPECSFACGPNNACPSAYSCAADNYCHLRLANNQLGACNFPVDALVVDAAVVDTVVVDAQPDAAIDARPDAAPVCPALSPTADGSGRQDLVISELRPGTFIELYNNTVAAINLPTSTFGLQADTATYALSAEAGMIEAHSYKTITWPAAFTISDSNGELGLFQNITLASDYTVAANLVDYVCWGGNTPANVAFAQGATKWTGTCTDELAASSLKRLASTDGLAKASYNVTGTPDPRNCTVP
ncbi:MAG: hypothetical protein KBG15_21865 [Kofleriaceae bacterium]|nr:hypothetical protein [Kofleriaceae bacterium]